MIYVLIIDTVAIDISSRNYMRQSVLHSDLSWRVRCGQNERPVCALTGVGSPNATSLIHHVLMVYRNGTNHKAKDQSETSETTISPMTGFKKDISHLWEIHRRSNLFLSSSGRFMLKMCEDLYLSSNPYLHLVSTRQETLYLDIHSSGRNYARLVFSVLIAEMKLRSMRHTGTADSSSSAFCFCS